MKRRSFLGAVVAAVSALVVPLPLLGSPPLAVIAAPCRASATDLFVPELWARHSLRVLKENMVISNMIHRDFHDDPGAAMDRVRIERGVSDVAV